MWVQTRKEEAKVSQFVDNMIVYISDPPQKIYQRTPRDDKQFQ